MTVLRVKKHEKNFVILFKQALDDDNLSLKSKGLWAYCMAKPDNWEFHIDQLESTLKEGRDAIRSAINELIKYGYCTRVQAKDDNGKWTKVDYEIMELPIFKKCLPQTGFPAPDNPTLIRNDNNKDIKERSSSSAPPAPPKVPSPQNGIQKLSAGNSRQPQIINTSIAPLDLKKEMRRRISSDISDEEFEEAWNRYESQPKGSVKSPFKWLTATLNNLRQENIGLNEKESKIGQRKEWALKHEYHCNSGYGCATSEGYEICSGNICTLHPYGTDNRFWSSNGL